MRVNQARGLARHGRRRLIVGGLGLLAGSLAAALSGCNPRRLKASATRSLILATPTDPKTFNYANNSSVPNIFLFCYEGLTKENGVTGEIEPALAQKWDVDADRRRIVFTLRPNLKWSDGHPLTAEDVVFTYRDLVFNPKVPFEVKELLKIGEKGEFPQVRQIDDLHIEFTFPEPFSPFLHATSAPGGVLIMPKHALASTLIEKDGKLAFLSTWSTSTPANEIVVNGPFRMERYVAGQRLIFQRNPYYWRKDQAGNPLPKVERIVWKVIENQDNQLLKFRSGELSVLGDSRPLKPEYYALLKQETERGNFRLLDGGPWSGVLQLVFNLSTAKNEKGKPFVDPIKAKWFNEVRFRQAVAYAIDKERINTNIFRGLGVVQHSPISVQSPYFLKPEQGLKVYSYDLDKAKALLTSAGFKYDAQGQLFDGDGHRVRFTLITNANNLTRVAIGPQIKQDLAKIGIQLDFQAINFNVLIDKINASREWDMHMVGFEGGVEPHAVANLWLSGGGSHSFNLKQQEGQPAIQGYAPKDFEREIDRLFVAGAREYDPAKRRKIYVEFQQLIAEQVPLIHLVNDRALMAVRNDVQGLRYSGLPFWGLWNIEEVKLEP
jgi:peptide/nickel transport system substrate-binding protein